MTVSEMVASAVVACEQMATQKPEYAGVIAEMKEDLLRVPSAGLVAATASILLEMADGTYTEEF